MLVGVQFEKKKKKPLYCSIVGKRINTPNKIWLILYTPTVQ